MNPPLKTMKNEYWIRTAGSKSFSVMKKNDMGMVSKVGTYRSFAKAEAIMKSLRAQPLNP